MGPLVAGGPWTWVVATVVKIWQTGTTQQVSPNATHCLPSPRNIAFAFPFRLISRRNCTLPHKFMAGDYPIVHHLGPNPVPSPLGGWGDCDSARLYTPTILDVGIRQGEMSSLPSSLGTKSRRIDVSCHPWRTEGGIPWGSRKLLSLLLPEHLSSTGNTPQRSLGHSAHNHCYQD